MRILLLVLCLSVANQVMAEPMSVMIKRVVVKGEDKVSGVLPANDPAAKMLSQSTGSRAPVRLEIETIKRFQQPGCKRIRMTFSQDLGKGKVFTTPFGEMNVCADGSPPLEGVDLDNVSKQHGF